MVPDIGDACGDFDDDHVRAVGNGFLTAGRCQAKGCQRYEADMQFTRESDLNGARQTWEDELQLPKNSYAT